MDLSSMPFYGRYQLPDQRVTAGKDQLYAPFPEWTMGAHLLLVALRVVAVFVAVVLFVTILWARSYK